MVPAERLLRGDQFSAVSVAEGVGSRCSQVFICNLKAALEEARDRVALLRHLAAATAVVVELEDFCHFPESSVSPRCGACLF